MTTMSAWCWGRRNSPMYTSTWFSADSWNLDTLCVPANEYADWHLQTRVTSVSDINTNTVDITKQLIDVLVLLVTVWASKFSNLS